MRFAGSAGFAVLVLSGCAAPEPKPAPASAIRINEDPYPSTYVRYPGVLTVIRNVTLFDGAGGQINDATIVFANGVITAVGGPQMSIPPGGVQIDGAGKFMTPGIIDIHSHLGDYPSPGVEANSDGNELTDRVHPDVWAEHSVWPQDLGFSRALINGGVTDPDSSWLGRSLWRSLGGDQECARSHPAGMKFRGAPYGLKMACGENPKRV